MKAIAKSGKLIRLWPSAPTSSSSCPRRNAPLRESHETLLSRAERARYLALGADRRWSNSVEEHEAILAALEARDGEAAGRLLSAHVQRTGTALLEVLPKSPISRPAA